MKTIYKYALPIEDKFVIKLPVLALIRTVLVDQKDDSAYLYAEVDTNSETELRTFEVFGTGHEISYDMGTNRIYLGTIQLCQGGFIGHVYERLL